MPSPASTTTRPCWPGPPARWQALPTKTSRKRSGSLELIEADLLEVELGARFGLAFLALNSLFLMATYERQVAAVQALARHLRPGGLAVVDVWLPSADELSAYDARVALEWLRPEEDGDPPGGQARQRPPRHVGRHGDADHVLRSLADGRRAGRADRRGPTTCASSRRPSSTAMAHAAGLRVELLAGDYRMEPFGPGAERVLLLGRLV